VTGRDAPRRGSDRASPSKRPSAIYRLVWYAIRARKQITYMYDGRYREACPHILGYKISGKDAVFVFQIGGESRSWLLPEGDWRCFDLDRMTDIRNMAAYGSPDRPDLLGFVALSHWRAASCPPRVRRNHAAPWRAGLTCRETRIPSPGALSRRARAWRWMRATG
jgi:hypothetical protein